jgi:DTW domain-containing protein YfiP
MPACWCQDLPVVETGTRVVFVQHPKEARMKVGTARMAHLCLPNSELYVGAFWDDDPRLDPILSDTERPAVLLFPGPDAVDVLAGSLAGPVTLVVVDGTWSQAGKMVRRNPRLAALPRVAFTPPKASDYRIRREPRPECVSTIEALVHVLGALEGNPEGPMALLEPFRKMVDFQVDCATRMHCPRVRMRRRRG